MTYFKMKHTHEMDIVNFVAMRRWKIPTFPLPARKILFRRWMCFFCEFSTLAGALCIYACLQLAEDRMHGRSGDAITFKTPHNGSYGMSVVILNKIREKASVPLLLKMRQTHQKIAAEKWNLVSQCNTVKSIVAPKRFKIDQLLLIL